MEGMEDGIYRNDRTKVIEGLKTGGEKNKLHINHYSGTTDITFIKPGHIILNKEQVKELINSLKDAEL